MERVRVKLNWTCSSKSVQSHKRIASWTLGRELLRYMLLKDNRDDNQHTGPSPSLLAR